jgi:hypothetical protein
LGKYFVFLWSRKNELIDSAAVEPLAIGISEIVALIIRVSQIIPIKAQPTNPVNNWL